MLQNLKGIECHLRQKSDKTIHSSVKVDKQHIRVLTKFIYKLKQDHYSTAYNSRFDLCCSRGKKIVTDNPPCSLAANTKRP